MSIFYNMVISLFALMLMWVAIVCTFSWTINRRWPWQKYFDSKVEKIKLCVFCGKEIQRKGDKIVLCEKKQHPIHYKCNKERRGKI